MSASISLKKTMARSSTAALDVIQLGLLIATFLFFIGMAHVLLKEPPPSLEIREQESSSAPLTVVVPDVPPHVEVVQSQHVPAAPVLSPKMQNALDYATRRYRLSPDTLAPVFEIVQVIGKERRIDPLLILSIIAVESGFNTFAESSMGARGLMQVIPRFHLDKLPAGASDRSLLDPVVNIQVGVKVLEDAIRRRGGLVAGLQHYAGSSDPEGSYAAKVLAEKERLEQAAAVRRRVATIGAPA